MTIKAQIDSLRSQTKTEDVVNLMDKRARRYEKHREKRRLELLEKATIVLAEHGLHALSIDGICHRLGVVKTVLYRYFDSREDLIRNTLDYARISLVEADTGAETISWQGHLKSAMKYMELRPDVFKLLYNQAAVDRTYREYYTSYFKDVLELVEQRIRVELEDSDRRPLDISFLSLSIVNFIFATLDVWLDRGDKPIGIMHSWLVHSVDAMAASWYDFPQQEPSD